MASREAQAAWELQVAVGGLLSGLYQGLIESAAGIQGDIQHAEKILTDAKRHLAVAHGATIQMLHEGLQKAREGSTDAAKGPLAIGNDRLMRITGASYQPMRYVEAPEPYVPLPDDGPVVMVAGGIMGCPDWQAQAAEAMRHRRLVLLNPRRADFDLGDPMASEIQVACEYGYRHHPDLDLMMFWFPASDPTVTVQPIALLELGEAMTRRIDVQMVVGVDPGYPRRTDVVLQLQNARPDVRVESTLPTTIEAALAAVR